ncbi:MAG: DegT/DnrJ/EryC1/StrS family aminotransferase [Polyangiaceae bacterium]
MAQSLPKVLLNDFKRQWADVGERVLEATRRVGESGWYILGSEVRSFECELATYLGRAEAVGCGNGLDAIEIGLRALGIAPGDRVLTTPLSAFATTLAIVRAGGVPLFCDVDRFGLLDLDRVEAVLEKDRGIRFLVPVHLYGHSLDLNRLEAIRVRFGVQIVEDCCQAIGASFGNKSVGSIGGAAALSFYPTKNLGAFGDGGAVLLNDSTVAAACRTLRDYGQTRRYHHDVIGLNSRLDELHAGVLRSALLPKLAGWTTRRRAVATQYIEGIQAPKVQVPGGPQGSNSVWHLFPTLVEPHLRSHFQSHLESCGVASAVHYPGAIPNQGAMGAVAHEVLAPLQRTAQYCDGEVSLPIHPYLTEDEVVRVIEAVNSWHAP